MLGVLDFIRMWMCVRGMQTELESRGQQKTKEGMCHERRIRAVEEVKRDPEQRTETGKGGRRRE